MAAALKLAHPLAPNCKMLVMIDPATGQLVDLARSGITFTLDSGATVVDDAIGKVLRVSGSIDGGTGSVIHQGVAWTPLSIPNTQAPSFAGTLFCVFSKWTGDDNGQIASYKLNSPFTNQVSNFPTPGWTNVGNTPSRRLALMKDNTEIATAVATMSSGTQFGDGLRHSVASVATNPAGGWAAVNGKLYLDGSDTGVALTNGVGGTAVFSGFNKLPNSLWKGDFVLMAYFDKALTAAEIADLHASIGNGGQFGLIDGVSAPAAAPTGTVTVGTVTVGTTTASVPFSYSAADQTGYDYRLNGGAVVSGSTASPISLTGLSAGTGYTIAIRATNATGAGAWSSSKAFTTNAAADATAPTLAGTITFSAISSTGYTAAWSAGADNVAVAGYEYQIGGTAGAWIDAGNVTSKAIAGRTAGATETLYVRAYDAAGNRSTPISASVTLSAAVLPTIAIPNPLKNNTGTPLANLTNVTAAVLRASDKTAVVTVTGLTTNASGMLSTISSAALTVGASYYVAVFPIEGGAGITAPIAAQ